MVSWTLTHWSLTQPRRWSSRQHFVRYRVLYDVSRYAVTWHRVHRYHDVINHYDNFRWIGSHVTSGSLWLPRVRWTKSTERSCSPRRHSLPQCLPAYIHMDSVSNKHIGLWTAVRMAAFHHDVARGQTRSSKSKKMKLDSDVAYYYVLFQAKNWHVRDWKWWLLPVLGVRANFSRENWGSMNCSCHDTVVWPSVRTPVCLSVCVSVTKCIVVASQGRCRGLKVVPCYSKETSLFTSSNILLYRLANGEKADRHEHIEQQISGHSGIKSTLQFETVNKLIPMPPMTTTIPEEAQLLLW